ncbi:hypothetical protein [Acinetobacter sp. ANC 4648]|uniref:hypothetical protein n=1 Tax=Acinetobacter sp. ANC 4648 TaxID=1977875 RepID=UPI000A34F597|nr:hypothetical protein [Acinetobacter sp. ANC 4648]OTG80040.1 hypothetical protein B9T27_13820 [Acinetobacter sp. ANC 4648]
MTFYKEVGILFGLSEAQSEQLEKGLKSLENEFDVADDVNAESFAKKFYQQFENLIKTCGIEDCDLEALVNHLYFTQETQEIVTFIIPSFYTAGGDREIFNETYELMMAELQLEQ